MPQSLQLERVTKAMKLKGLSQRLLAQEVGVSPQTVTNWLKPAGDFPRPAALLKLAKALELRYSELVEPEVPAPVIAFRRKGATKTTLEHYAKASRMGQMLRPLVEHLKPKLSEAVEHFRDTSTDYDNIQRLAKRIRAQAGIAEVAAIQYSNLVRCFQENAGVLVPVLWGKNGRHENALHILLQDEQVTFVYLNLDIAVEDFKFMMAHELAHIHSPELCGKDEGEDFADAIAGAVVFPYVWSAETYRQCLAKASKGGKLSCLEAAAQAHGVSLFTVYTEVNKFAARHGLAPLGVDDKSIHQRRRMQAGKSVAEELWAGKELTAAQYIEAASSTFKSPFFDALSALLQSGKGGPGYVQQVLDIAHHDAKELHGVLSGQTSDPA
jgi:transcriptional regulator with XRE-family HTH domain